MVDPYQYTAGEDINFEYAPVVADKKRRKRKKKGGTTAEVTLHADGRGVTINNIPTEDLHGAATTAAESIWNVTAAEERSRVRAFWLSLSEAERLDLVRLDKEVLLAKVRRQRHPCGCTVCGKKRVAVEQELEALYQAYYCEIEAFGDRELPAPVPAPPTATTAATEDEFSDYYEQYDELGGGILSVADDLLKNDGRRFVDVMEHLASQRIQREPPDRCEEDDELDFDDDSILSDDRFEEERLADGRRMLQIFAARMFEQRVLNAYREHVARERQQQLLLEIDAEDEAHTAKEAKRLKEKEKRKSKKAIQRQQREEIERARLLKEEQERARVLEVEERRRKQRADEEREKEARRRNDIEQRMAALALSEKKDKEPKVEAKVDLKAEPKAEPNVETKAEPKVEPKEVKLPEPKTPKKVKKEKKSAPQAASTPQSAPLAPQSVPGPGLVQQLQSPTLQPPALQAPLQHAQPQPQAQPQAQAQLATSSFESSFAQPQAQSQLAQQFFQKLPAQSPFQSSLQMQIPLSQQPLSQPLASYQGSASAAAAANPWFRRGNVTPSFSNPWQPTAQPPAMTPASTKGLWTPQWSSTSADRIRNAAIDCCKRLTADGLAPDGFVPSQVLYHATMDSLGSSISQNELFQACGVDSHFGGFECMRDHVGLVTHVRYVQS